MGGARNLKLGAATGEGKGQGKGGNKFCVCGSNVDLISVVVCIEKM